jgi:hypothetical protein
MPSELRHDLRRLPAPNRAGLSILSTFPRAARAESANFCDTLLVSALVPAPRNMQRSVVKSVWAKTRSSALRCGTSSAPLARAKVLVSAMPNRILACSLLTASLRLV